MDRSVLVSLERLIPADHFYRHLDAMLDLSFVREWVVDPYATGGRPSIDPVVFFLAATGWGRRAGPSGALWAPSLSDSAYIPML